MRMPANHCSSRASGIQWAIVYSEIEPLRSPGHNADPEKLAAQMEIALWLALTVILKVTEEQLEAGAVRRAHAGARSAKAVSPS